MNDDAVRAQMDRDRLAGRPRRMTEPSDLGEPDERRVFVYTIFDRPDDFPDDFVCRKFESGGVTPREVVGTGKTLEEVRQCLPPGLTMLARVANDDPNIVETWL